jgi:hypothetical protein
MRWRILLTLLLVVAAPASLQAQQIIKFGSGSDIKRALFVGGEARIGALYAVLSNCASGPRPDVRIVKGAANGDLRFEAIVVPVTRPPGNPRANCNGKNVNAVGVFYKAKEGFAGEERIVLEADYKLGAISRYNFLVTVR